MPVVGLVLHIIAHFWKSHKLLRHIIFIFLRLDIWVSRTHQSTSILEHSNAVEPLISTLLRHHWEKNGWAIPLATALRINLHNKQTHNVQKITKRLYLKSSMYSKQNNRNPEAYNDGLKMTGKNGSKRTLSWAWFLVAFEKQNDAFLNKNIHETNCDGIHPSSTTLHRWQQLKRFCNPRTLRYVDSRQRSYRICVCRT